MVYYLSLLLFFIFFMVATVTLPDPVAFSSENEMDNCFFKIPSLSFRHKVIIYCLPRFQQMFSTWPAFWNPLCSSLKIQKPWLTIRTVSTPLLFLPKLTKATSTSKLNRVRKKNVLCQMVNAGGSIQEL